MFVEEEYKEKNKYDYFALMYLAKVDFDETNKKNVEIISDFEPRFIRKKYEFENDGVEVIECKSTGKIQERLMILPTLLRSDEENRDVLYLSAHAGAGKSYFLNTFCELYKSYYKDNQLYFLTGNDYKADKSLSHEIYNELNMNEFIDMLKENQEEIAKNGEIFKDSLICCDDIGVVDHDKKKQKEMWQFINTVLENARKRKLSLIICSHVPTNYRLTSVLVRECVWYIVFPSNAQVRSDRLLNAYLGLNKKQVLRITDLEDNSRWVAINTKKKIVVTEFKVYSLKDTKK